MPDAICLFSLGVFAIAVGLLLLCDRDKTARRNGLLSLACGIVIAGGTIWAML